MTSLALSDHDMFLVRDIVETCSDVSGEAELLPWQLGEELFQLIECDALPPGRVNPPSATRTRARTGPATLTPHCWLRPKRSGPISGTPIAHIRTAPVTSCRSR